MHWDSPWLKKERPSGAWGRFGEWVQQGEAATRTGQVGPRGAGRREALATRIGQVEPRGAGSGLGPSRAE